jgi:FK506-binding nuclear protein
MCGLLQVAKDGQKVSVRYRGTLAKSGKVFDETKGNKTFTFRLGGLPLQQ